MKVILFLFLFLNLSASTLNMHYIGELSLFGKVGSASIFYYNDGKNYRIKVSFDGTGIAATLTNHKHYAYESIGIVENNTLIPMKYIGSQTSHDLNKTKTYVFDYENSKTVITKYKSEKIEKSIFNVFSLELDSDTEVVQGKEVEILDELYKDDMVSIFFNKRLNLLSMQEDETKLIHAVGSTDTQKGMIIKLLKKIDDRFTYSINIKKDYLDGGSNDATFVLDDNNILCETRLDGILFFGNATIKRLE